MSTLNQPQKHHVESQSLLYFTSTIKGENKLMKVSKTHMLYSRGRFFDGVSYFQALDSIADLIGRKPQDVEKFLLSGKRKRILSS